MFASILSFDLFHTVANALPLGLGLLAFARDSKIGPGNWVGKLYLFMLLAGSARLWGLPVAHGFALGPSLMPARLVLLAAFVRGLGFQLLGLRDASAQNG